METQAAANLRGPCPLVLTEKTMFEELFNHQPTLEKHRAAPLVEERLRFLKHLQGQGAARQTLKRKATNLLRLVCLLDLNEPEYVSHARIKAAADEWSRPGTFRIHTTASPETKASFVSDALRWLRFLGWREPRVKPPLHPHAAEVDAFSKWAREERGYAEASIESWCQCANLFFKFLATSNTPLASVSISDIDRAFLARTAPGTVSRATMSAYAKHLRKFFRFAEDRGWCRRGIADGIAAPRLYVNESVPSRVTRDDVLRLLATTEGERPVDKRDRAILMVLITYGLRNSELRSLRLDHIDWEEETLTVPRAKTGHTGLLPLSPRVGQAIVRYIVDVRPSHPDRTLFLTLKAPIGPISTRVLWGIVGGRLRSLGVTGPKTGPHSLRHAAAQHLLDQGASMKVIGDYLGHRSPSSTRAYAKIDVNNLRQVANMDLGGLA